MYTSHRKNAERCESIELDNNWIVDENEHLPENAKIREEVSKYAYFDYQQQEEDQ